MKVAIKSLLSGILKNSYGESIAVKPYKGTNSSLYYERSQHLMFAFKNKIQYEPIIQQKLKKYCKEATLVFDIGGNIGQYALLFSELVAKNGKIISLEPDHKNFSFLNFNININKLKNVVCIKKGISDKQGVTEFYRDTETGGRRGSFDKGFVGENFKGFTEKVETTTLDDLVKEFGEPQFIKIDVEGFECNVIKGLTISLKNTVFLIEVRQETKKEIFDYFKKREYICYYIDNKEDVVINSSEQIPGFANLIFKRP